MQPRLSKSSVREPIPSRSESVAPKAPIAVSPGWAASELDLRPLRAADADAFIHALHASRERVIPFMPISRAGEDPREAFERQLTLTARTEQDGTGWRRAAFSPTGELAGCMQVFGIDRGLTWTGEVSLWVAEGFVGRGVGADLFTRAVRHALAPLPDGLGLHEVWADTQRDNAPAVALLRRLGFERRPEGDSRLLVGEAWLEHDRYALSA